MLTTQKRKFALALMSGKNKTASAIAAGYSAKTARVKGSQLAKDPEVLAFIARKEGETVEVDEVPVYRQKKQSRRINPVAVRRLQFHSRTKPIRRCHRPW
ncbi:hypothetical protein ERYG_05097 [Escherichia coli M114]|nr:hypothetical protein ERYG_05097 [Escherichia coli M114]